MRVDVHPLQLETGINSETQPKNHLDVGFFSVYQGGSGDLSVCAKFVDSLSSTPRSQYYKQTVFTMNIDDSPERLRAFSDQLHEAPVIAFSQGSYNSDIGGFEHEPMLDGKLIQADVDVLISIHAHPPDELIKDGTVSIQLSEYGSPPEWLDLPNNIIGVGTGFTFNPDSPSVQAGLVYSQTFESLLHDSEQEGEAQLVACEAELRQITGEAINLRNGKIALYYSSDWNTNHIYFDVLKEASQHLHEPIIIIALVGNSHEPQSYEEFEEKVKSLGFNYISANENSDRASNVTIVNPHRVSPITFQRLLIHTQLPSVVTGDQSLTEMIQKGLSEHAAPFFVINNGFKQLDFVRFIEKIDPTIAHLFASYFALDLTEEERVEIENGDAIDSRESRQLLDIGRDTTEVARLFYDQTLIDRFNGVIRQIPGQMKKDREGYLEIPDVLVDATKTIEYILQLIRMGKLEDVEKLIPHKKT